jgi:phosphatidylinositol alpha-mannosyltransferase
VTAILLKPAPLVGTYHAAGRSLSYEMLGFGMKRLAKRIDKNFVVSEEAERLVRSNLGGSYERVFNAVSLALFEVVEPISTHGPTILFVGRHEERKGLEVLIDAMATLPSNYTLWIGGDGPDTARLKDRAAGDRRIQWLGRLSETDKVSHMLGCSVLCAPSLHGESFGIVLIEAMAAGAPVVASDIEGYSKVARGGRDAVLVPPADPQALAREIMELLGDDHRREQLISSGRERAEEFSMSALADRYVQSYESLL